MLQNQAMRRIASGYWNAYLDGITLQQQLQMEQNILLNQAMGQITSTLLDAYLDCYYLQQQLQMERNMLEHEALCRLLENMPYSLSDQLVTDNLPDDSQKSARGMYYDITVLDPYLDHSDSNVHLGIVFLDAELGMFNCKIDIGEPGAYYLDITMMNAEASAALATNETGFSMMASMFTFSIGYDDGVVDTMASLQIGSIGKKFLIDENGDWEFGAAGGPVGFSVESHKSSP